MKYERLTNPNIEEYNPEYDFCCDCKYYGEPNGCNRTNGECANYERFMEMYTRLTDLEDKIENGTLVEPPYKLGDTVWFINKFVLFMGCPNIAIMCGKISRVIANISNEITYMYDVNVESTRTAAGYETYAMASRVIFPTKAEAEKRLEEMKSQEI